MSVVDLIEALGYEADAIRGWIDAFDLLHPNLEDTESLDYEEISLLKTKQRRLDEIARQLREAQQ